MTKPNKLYLSLILLLLCGFKIHDGDTFTMDDGTIIRLFGVDAPEEENSHTDCPEQMCQRADGSTHRCAREATDFLVDFFAKHHGALTCVPKGASYGREVGDCYIGQASISEAMVRSGWAIEERFYSHGRFTIAENEAKLLHLGIWQGKFTKPYNYRKACKAKYWSAKE